MLLLHGTSRMLSVRHACMRASNITGPHLSNITEEQSSDASEMLSSDSDAVQ